jgi:hypothetical protein
MKNKYFLFFVIILGLFISCNQKEIEIEIKKVDIGKENNYSVFADTIINDVLIQNPDSSEWTDYCLRNLHKDFLVDEIFNAVYSGKLIPYEFFNNVPLEITDIESLEEDPEFSRDKIAKVQFEEAWYFDTENQIMVKKVYSIMLAYEVYNLEGEIKGYKPAFKVYFK